MNGIGAFFFDAATDDHVVEDGLFGFGVDGDAGVVVDVVDGVGVLVVVIEGYVWGSIYSGAGDEICNHNDVLLVVNKVRFFII